MIETLRFTKSLEGEARNLDAELIEDRRSIVGTNMLQLTGVRRSDKFVARKAGISNDHPRRSATQDALLWTAATAIEDAERMAQVQAFWQPVFDYASMHQQRTRPLSCFWDVQEEIEALLSQLRRSYLDGNRIEARFTTVKIRERANDLLRLCDGIPDFAR